MLLRRGARLWALVGTAWAWVRDDPVRAMLRAAERAGPGVARRVWPLALLVAHPIGQDGVRAGRPVRLSLLLRVVALQQTGQRAALHEALRHGAAGDARSRAWAARLSLELDEHVLAQALVARDSPTDPLRAEIDGRVLLARGAFSAAAAALALAAPQTRRVARWQARVQGELRALEPTWRAGDWRAGRARAAVRTSSEPSRVLHLLTNSLPYKQAGYTIRSQQAAVAQRRDGLDVHVATRLGFPLLDGHLWPPEGETVDGVPHWRLLPVAPLPTRPDRFLERYADAATHLAERLRPAVLHAVSKHTNAQVALAVRERLGLPVVYEVRGFLEETWLASRDLDAARSDRYRLSRGIETACMSAADHVITLSEVMRAEILARGVPEERVTVVPHALDDRFLAPPPDGRPLRRRLGLGDGEIVLGYVSSLSSYEGIDHLVEATALLAAGGLPVRLLVVGEGPERGPLERLADRLGLADRVVFAGRVPHVQVPQHYAAIDVFVVPRRDVRVCRLVTPLKPVEAMASARPLVVTALDALREIVDESRAGLVAPPDDPVGLAEVLRGLIEDPSRRERLGGAARAWATEHRTWRANASRYRRVYESLGVA